MPIEMPKGVPFSVDTWSSSSQMKRHHFLTHAHRDHSVGITSYASFPIYSTGLTKTLVLSHYPQLDESLFVGIEVGESLVIDDPDGPFTVTAFDANHCPGAVMFLFEGIFGNILHTGDCRLTLDCLQNLPEKYLGKREIKPRSQLDYVFLDCTFGKYSQSMPSKHSAIRQVINCIWKHPEAPRVYLTSDLLGQEEILAEVSQTFGSKIYVDKLANPGRFYALELTFPDILTEDPSSRFYLFNGFPRLSERAKSLIAEAQTCSQPEPLIIRPSSQWYACEEEYFPTEYKLRQRFHEAVKDESGVWHVCYSIHSSREELEWALQLLAPKWVASTTPNCWAMDLAYVKKSCLVSRISSDDPLWNLLEIGQETCSTATFTSKSEDSSPDELELSQACVECVQSVKSITYRKDVTKLSSPNKRPALTLFGRARFGLPDSPYVYEDKVSSHLDDGHLKISAKKQLEYSCEEETVYEIDHEKAERKQEGSISEAAHENLCEKEAGIGEHLPCSAERELSSSHCVIGGEKEAGICEHLPCLAKMEEGISPFVPCSPKKVPGIRKRQHYSPLGSSKSFSGSLRKLYRSMNVSVPQPLPSLMELNTRSLKRNLVGRGCHGIPH